MFIEASELFPEVPNLYEYPSIQSSMIYDQTRSDAYYKAITEVIHPGNVVTDIGTGTGLLAFLCIKAGASRVHAIESSSMINYAKAIAAANNLFSKINFHHCNFWAAKLGEKVDVIVSELIGHLAFEEGMMEIINDAKRHFLKPDGRLIPQIVSLHAAPAFHPDFYQQYIDVWKKPVCGLDFSFWRERSLQTPWVTEVTPEKLIAPEQELTRVDFLQGINPQENNHNYFLVEKAAQTNGVAFWFEAQLSDHVHLSSAPGTSTHWQQCFAPISQPFSVSPGNIIEINTKMGFRTQKDNKFTFTWTAEKV